MESTPSNFTIVPPLVSGWLSSLFLKLPGHDNSSTRVTPHSGQPCLPLVAFPRLKTWGEFLMLAFVGATSYPFFFLLSPELKASIMFCSVLSLDHPFFLFAPRPYPTLVTFSPEAVMLFLHRTRPLPGGALPFFARFFYSFRRSPLSPPDGPFFSLQPSAGAAAGSSEIGDIPPLARSFFN